MQHLESSGFGCGSLGDMMELKRIKQVLAGHITESEDFNEKHPDVLRLCDKADQLRADGEKAVMGILEAMKKLKALCSKIPEDEFPDSNQRSSESKNGYISKLNLQLEKYEEALTLFMHYAAS